MVTNICKETLINNNEHAKTLKTNIIFKLLFHQNYYNV